MSISINNLNYYYGKGTPYEKQALKNINIEIKNGEFIGLIGHTGSGKSTLIQHLNGLLKADSGAIIYNGENIYSEKYNMRELRKKVGLVFQYPEHQLFEMTVYKDVAFGPSNLGLDKDEIESRVVEAMNTVGLTSEIYEKSPFELSGGQKRRVAIAGVLAMKPEVLILDEPTAGLDPQGRDEILEEIHKLYQELGITIILVSHSMEDIAKYAKRLVVMEGGNILYDDVPSKVFKNYKNLEKIGLSAPQITYLVNELRSKGIEIQEDITTIEEAKKTLLSLLR